MAVFLRDPSDQSGALLKFESEDEAEQAIAAHGFEYASDDEVQARTLERSHGGRNAEAFLNSAAAGAFDVAVAAPKLVTTGSAALSRFMGDEGAAREFDAIGEQLSGRQFMENLVAVATELSGGGNAEAAALSYKTDTQKVAEANPWASTSGYLGGQVLAAGAGGLAGASSSLGKAAASAAQSSALGRSALAMAAEGAAEGALLTGGQATEEAWIKNEKLSSEQLMASIGWGTLLGAGAGAAIGTGIYGAGAVYRGGKAAASAAGDSLRGVFGPRVSASADDVAEVASGALGVKVSKEEGGKLKSMLESVRDTVENAQAALTDVDLDDLKAAGPMRWDAAAISDRDAFINRDAIKESAKVDLQQGLQEFTDASASVVDEVRYVGLKYEHIKANISDNAAEQLAAARQQADALEEMVTPLRKPGSSGKTARQTAKDEPVDREAFIQTFDELERPRIDDELDDDIREQLEELGVEAVEGERKWKDVEQSILRERRDAILRQRQPAAAVDPNAGQLRAELGSPGILDEIESFVSRNIAAIRKTDDPALAYSLVEQTKRAMQKYADNAGVSAEALARTSPERALLARRRSDYIQKYQEPRRVFLENEPLWGRQGVNQQAINASLTRHIEGDRAFQSQFISRTKGYRGLGGQRVVREEATRSFINKFGLADNQSNEQFLRAQLRSTLDVLGAIDGSLDLGEKKALVQKASDTAKRLNGMLDSLDRNVKGANRVERLIKAGREEAGGVSKALLGSLVGGIPGAVIGTVVDVLTNPAKQVGHAVAIQRLARRHGVKIDQVVDRLLPKGKAKAARDAVDVGASPANDVFKDEVSGVTRVPSPVSLEGKTLDDLRALPLDQNDRAATLKGLRESDEFAATGRAPKRFDRLGHEQGITIVKSADGVGDGLYLRDGRHRFSVAKEKNLQSVWGTVVDDDGEVLFRGDIPLRAADPATATEPALAASPRVAAARGRGARGAAIPVALAAFLGSHEDKQLAFRERAKEIHDATADMGERVREVVGRDMADLNESFPGFTGSLAAGMTRAALFLESKLPSSYRAAAPGAPGRSMRPVADHDIAKFARYWSAVHDPVSVLHDMALGTVSGEQIEAVKAVYPELYVSLSEKLLERAADIDAAGGRIPMQTRMQLGRFVGVQIEPAFKSSVLGLLDQARQGRDQGAGQGRPSAPPNLAQSAGPESVQMQARAASVG